MATSGYFFMAMDRKETPSLVRILNHDVGHDCVHDFFSSAYLHLEQ